ncbi:MAG: hypothetical protein LBV58_03200 [Acholeplasmatales bacterium]|jgi:hypothetical protein|nr:hypothetical protein [Acholeplasmatales bacterium]
MATDIPNTKLGLLYKYKLLIFIGMALFIGLLVILFIYLIPYTKNNKVFFEAESTPNTVYVTKFDKIDSNRDFKIDIVWDTLTIPKKDASDKLTGGSYKFSFTFEEKTSVHLQNFRVTPLLQTKWVEYRGLGSQLSLAQGISSSSTINFNYTLPTSPLWFVRVDDPILYLKVEYNEAIAGIENTKTVYLSLSLKNLDPHSLKQA